MSLTPRLVAIQGIGFTAIAMAVQGLLESIDAIQPPAIIAPFVSGCGGPDANLSLSDYLKKFGKAGSLPAIAAPVHTPAQRAAKARKKRQRMEEEIFALLEY